MMLDADIVAVSPASVWRVLGQAGLLRRWNGKPSKKGTGFEQPPAPHQHWHIDVSYINIAGTFYYLCTVLDGFSRFIVHWDLRPAMTEADIEIILQAAREQHPQARPRVISDNGPQFIARDFKEFIRWWESRMCGALLPAVQRQAGTLAQVAESKSSGGYPANAGGWAAADSAVRGPLQHCAAAQRHWIRDAGSMLAGARKRSAARDRSWRRSASDNCAVNRRHEIRVTMALQVKRKRALRGRNHAEG
jgi:transposase InsO family protein